MEEAQSYDWLDQLVAQIIEAHPTGELVVSSGHSPSGTYHIGTLREVMTANAIAWALRRAGREARHVDFVDDFDAFRKVPAEVPEEWSRYIGVPLAAVPDPFDCHKSYGAHYLAQLTEGLRALGAVPDEVISGYDNYRQSKFDDQIAQSLDRLEDVRRILTEVGGRKLDEHWAPVQILDDDNNLRTRKFAGWDANKRLVTWRDRDGQTGEMGLGEGRLKLDWRLDWPARWAKFGVTVEPFGRDHATKGGSYDTGKVLVRDIFGGQPPFPVPYEFIITVGETKKMSKSAGNVLTPADALEVMPAEVLRYFIVQSRPGRTLYFDSGLGLYSLIEDYAKRRHQPTAAIAYAAQDSKTQTIADVPFSHLVAVYQAARGEDAAIRAILERTGFADAATTGWDVTKRELTFASRWLVKYAPDKVKFEVQDKLPDMVLSADEATFLHHLADALEALPEPEGQAIHDAIYAAAEATNLKATEAFRVIYQTLLGQTSGPKAGWFLASLDQPWLIKRLRRQA